MDDVGRLLNPKRRAFRTAMLEQMLRIGVSRSREILAQYGYSKAIDCPPERRAELLLAFALEGRS